MNVRTSLIFAAIALSAASAGASAVTVQQIQSIRSGESQEAVIQALGKPLNTPTWLNGTHSLVYALSDSSNLTARAYVDVGPDNKVRVVQFSDDGRSN
ncbi:MAG: hypothetical protein REI09_12710 [Candidatus Dactylopiibacterium sp.]|nr:hypothetical protein [Candidatus Dactylopiibacterium sp.]